MLPFAGIFCGLFVTIIKSSGLDNENYLVLLPFEIDATQGGYVASGQTVLANQGQTAA
jgi:hypothetical protein